MPRGEWSDYDPATNTFLEYDAATGRHRRVNPDGSGFNGIRRVGNIQYHYLDGVATKQEEDKPGRAPSQAVPAAQVRAGAAEDVANITADAHKWVAQLNAEIAKATLEQTKAHNAAMEALESGRIEESRRQFDLSHTLAQRIADLNDNKFAWQQKIETATVAHQEHLGRIQEAAVTGYYRPSADTPFSRPVSSLALAAAAPSVRQALTAGGTAKPPPYGNTQAGPQTAAPPPSTNSTQPPPATNTKDLNLDELHQLFGGQAQGARPSANAPAAAPGASQSDSSRFTSQPGPLGPQPLQQQGQQQVRKRTVTEEFV